MITKTRRFKRNAPRFAAGVVASVLLLGHFGPVAGAAVPEPVHLMDTAVTAPAPAAPMLVNMHNAADTTTSAAQAVAAHPSMIEFDVSWDGGQLVVAHTLLPAPFRQDATDLTQAWSRANGDGSVRIDATLQSSAAERQLVSILRQHRDRPIYVSTPDATVLRDVHGRAPWVHGLLSLNTGDQVEQLLGGDTTVPGLYGVSAADHLLTRPVVSALRRHGLFVLAYSVNDMPRIDMLAGWGVRGITTDNLAVVHALVTPRNAGLPQIGQLTTEIGQLHRTAMTVVDLQGLPRPGVES